MIHTERSWEVTRLATPTKFCDWTTEVHCMKLPPVAGLCGYLKRLGGPQNVINCRPERLIDRDRSLAVTVSHLTFHNSFITTIQPG